MIITKKINILIILFYLSLLLGFFLDEDSIGGAFNDYEGHAHIAENLNQISYIHY